MKPERRVVTALPLQELWSICGWTARDRIRDLEEKDVQDLLRSGPVRFVIADVGLPLQWVLDEERFRFWKTEVRPLFAQPDSQSNSNDFPGRYFYWASEWKDPESRVPIVLLEKEH